MAHLRAEQEFELGRVLSPKDRAIHNLNSISENFLINLILKPLDETCVLSLNKQHASALCDYLRENWNQINDRKLITLIHKLVDEEEVAVIDLVKQNITLYCCLKLRIAALIDLKIENSAAFNESYSNKLAQQVTQYKTKLSERKDLFRKIKQYINGYYIVPVEKYTYAECRKAVLQLQIFLITKLKEKFFYLENGMIPGHARKDTQEKLNQYRAQLEQDDLTKPAKFTPLYESFAKYFIAMELYRFLGRYVEEARLISELIQNLQSLLAKLNSLPNFELNKIPVYRFQFMDLDYFDVINAWHSLAVAHINYLEERKKEVPPVEEKQPNKAIKRGSSRNSHIG